MVMGKRLQQQEPAPGPNKKNLKLQLQGSADVSPKGGNDSSSSSSSSASTLSTDEVDAELSSPDGSKCDSDGKSGNSPLCVVEGVQDDQVEEVEGLGHDNAASGDEGERDSDSDHGNGEPRAGSEMQEAVLAERVAGSLPRGPDSYEKLYDYRREFTRKLLTDSPDSEVHAANLKAILSRKLLQHDAYSGLGTASICCRQTLESMSRCLQSSDFACKLIVGIK